MPIRYYLSILVASSLIGGYVVEFLSDGRHNNFQSLAEAQNNRLLIQKDFEYFRQNVSQLLISADLILGSDETYLIQGALTQAQSLTAQARMIANDSMLGDRQTTAAKLLSSLANINKLLHQAAAANVGNRQDTLNKLLNKYDESSIELVTAIGVIESVIVDTVKQGKINLALSKQSLKRTTLISIFLFSAIIFLLWLWSDRKISQPLALLAKLAENAESESRFDEINKAPREVLQLSARLAAATNSLIEQAQLDPLTHLLNRREFERRLTNLLNKNDENMHESPGVICYIDLDHFKIVNDTCGHAAGDEILIRVASALSDTLRVTDIVSRLGGDEFGIVFVGCPLDKATDIANRLRELVEKIDYKWNGEIFRISASIGLSEIPAGHTDLKAIVNTVDAACSAAKNGGRNRVQILDSTDASVAQNRNEMILVNQIYNAIEQSNFVLYSQPIVELGKSRAETQHFEVLIRMLDSAGTVVLPAQFLPTVERYQLSSGVDKWVIQKTFDYLHDNRRQLDQIELINVNLSGQSLGNLEFCEFVESLFRRTPEFGEKICFEVTETAASTNAANAQNFVTTMREFGTRFALDDFGTGHSSFNYLKAISFDFIKIDGSFIQGMLKSSLDLETVISVIKLAETSGAKVVAEYVDNPEIEQKLIDLGVQYGQGFLYSEPVPLEEVTEYLSAVAVAG